MGYTQSLATTGVTLLYNTNRARRADLDFLISEATTKVNSPQKMVHVYGVGNCYVETAEQRVAVIEIRRRYYESAREGFVNITDGFPQMVRGFSKEMGQEMSLLCSGLIRITANRLNNVTPNDSILAILSRCATTKVTFTDGSVTTAYGTMWYQNEVQRRALIELSTIYERGIELGIITMKAGIPQLRSEHRVYSLVLEALWRSFATNKNNHFEKKGK